MFGKYLKETFIYNKNPFSIFKFNIFCFFLMILYFFAVPLFLPFYFIRIQKTAFFIKTFFIFIFIMQIFPVSICVYANMQNKNKKIIHFFSALKKEFANSVLFAAIKFFAIIIFITSLRLCLKNENTVFLSVLISFLFFYFEFITFWFIPLQTQNKTSFINALKTSAKIFISRPAFTCFVFIHNLFIFFISAFLLMLYPGISKILFNINSAYSLIKSDIDF